MPTSNPRITITLKAPIAALLAQLAKHEHKSVSNFAEELLLESLERREDRVLSTIAEARDLTKVKRIKHKNAWK